MAVTASIVAKRYQILSELGRGGMGVVYRVRHCFTDEKLALKVLNDSLVRQDRAVSMRDRKKRSDQSLPGDVQESPWTVRFKREMQISAKIGSEHVVRITDADVAPELGGALFYVMELLRGSDLDHLLQDRGPFSPEETAWIVYQLAEGLDKAHKVGIVHRDLKPANLFVHQKPDGELILKILDFGLAFLVADAPKSDSPDKLTKTGATLGTLNYFAPEQAMGQRERIAPPTDVWAIGAIVFELLTGDCYFPGNDHTVAVRIARGDLQAPSTRSAMLSKAFDRWFANTCAVDPAQRFTSVRQQALQLADALGLDEATKKRLDDGVAPESLVRWATDRPATSENDLPELPVDPMAATKMGASANPKAATGEAPAAPDSAASATVASGAATPIARSEAGAAVTPIAEGGSRRSTAASTTDSGIAVSRLTTFQFALIIIAFAVVAVLALIPISMLRKNQLRSERTDHADAAAGPRDSAANSDAAKSKPETVQNPVPGKDATPPVATTVQNANAEEGGKAGQAGKTKKKNHKKGKAGKGGKPEKPNGAFDPEAP